MTPEELSVKIKADITDRVSELVGSPNPDEIAAYVLDRYTGLDLSRVTNVRASINTPGVLSVNFTWSPEPEYVTVHLPEPECQPER